MSAIKTANLQYLNHPLNLSKSKSAYSFRKSNRFPQETTYSPNKFYDQPLSRSRRSASIGIGSKINFAKPDAGDPSKYHIKSPFDQNRGKKGYSFGISRQEFYKGKIEVNAVGPGRYDVSDRLDKKHFYIGQRFQQKEKKDNLSPNTYKIKSSAINLLSNHRNSQLSTRMKTQYYVKPLLSDYDNKVPGPGSYAISQQENLRKALASHNRKNSPTNTSFGYGQKMKPLKSISNIGPGSYKIFSEFGPTTDLPSK